MITDSTTTQLQSTLLFNEIRRSIKALDENKKNRLLNQVNGVFEFRIKSDSSDDIQVFTIDLKHDGSVSYGALRDNEPDTIICMGDSDFVSLAYGRITSQRAYNLSKLKVKGQMKCATKLDLVLKQLRGKCNL